MKTKRGTFDGKLPEMDNEPMPFDCLMTINGIKRLMSPTTLIGYLETLTQGLKCDCACHRCKCTTEDCKPVPFITKEVAIELIRRVVK